MAYQLHHRQLMTMAQLTMMEQQLKTMAQSVAQLMTTTQQLTTMLRYHLRLHTSNLHTAEYFF